MKMKIKICKYICKNNHYIVSFFKKYIYLYYFVIKNQLEGVFNAVSPNPINNADLTKAIAKTLHKPLFLPNIPEFVMKIILGEMSILLFSSKNLSSKKIQDCGFIFKFPEIQKALNNLYQ